MHLFVCFFLYLASDPVCSSNISSNVAAEGDVIARRCEVTYRGKWSPQMAWFDTSGSAVDSSVDIGWRIAEYSVYSQLVIRALTNLRDVLSDMSNVMTSRPFRRVFGVKELSYVVGRRCWQIRAFYDNTTKFGHRTRQCDKLRTLKPEYGRLVA